jgi:hypothetical protein
VSVVVVPSIALIVALAGASSSADYETAAIAAYHAGRSTAQTVFFHDCGVPDQGGKVVCHTCGNELQVGGLGTVRDYADYNVQIFVSVAGSAHLETMEELSSRVTWLGSEEGSKEKVKGPDAYKMFLTDLFDDGNRWCARFGGVRHDLKDVIDDAAHGKLVGGK